MKILLFGKVGQLGWELNRSLQPLGDIVALDRGEVDFSKPESLRQVVRDINPDVICNAVAYTAVDKAEEEEELAMKINGISPGVLAEEAKKLGALLVHYSTDYIFDGTKASSYDETDTPNPVNAYGRTKLAGELSIQSLGCDYLILRTSWVYASRGQNFLLSMLRLAAEKKELTIVDDQLGVPTWARSIADITCHVISKSLAERDGNVFRSDIYNVSASGQASWFLFAKEIIELAKKCEKFKHLKVKSVTPISSVSYPTPAERPMNSKLSTSKLSEKFDINVAEWSEHLKLCVDELC